jgi:prepilin-type N-terminal cleavage/methylation domain-containing protein
LGKLSAVTANKTRTIKVKRGFTFEELAVVVTIAGILAAVALPAVQTHVARDKVVLPRRRKCLQVIGSWLPSLLSFVTRCR